MKNSDSETYQNFPRTAAAPTALPENEPAALPLLHSRSDVQAQIADLEGSLQYMGGLHPRLKEMQQRLHTLKDLLQRWNQLHALQRR